MIRLPISAWWEVGSQKRSRTPSCRGSSVSRDLGGILLTLPPVTLSKRAVKSCRGAAVAQVARKRRCSPEESVAGRLGVGGRMVSPDPLGVWGIPGRGSAFNCADPSHCLLCVEPSLRATRVSFKDGTLSQGESRRHPVTIVGSSQCDGLCLITWLTQHPARSRSEDCYRNAIGVGVDFVLERDGISRPALSFFLSQPEGKRASGGRLARRLH